MGVASSDVSIASMFLKKGFGLKRKKCITSLISQLSELLINAKKAKLQTELRVYLVGESGSYFDICQLSSRPG